MLTDRAASGACHPSGMLRAGSEPAADAGRDNRWRGLSASSN